jgi:hypothetical protein
MVISGKHLRDYCKKKEPEKSGLIPGFVNESLIGIVLFFSGFI